MSHISAKDVTFLGLVFVLMAPAGRFALLSDNEVIVFFEQIRTGKLKIKNKRLIRCSGYYSKRDMKTENRTLISPVELQAIILYVCNG